MAARSRYSVSAKGAGMDDGVLKNKLGLKNQKSLDDAETLLLADTYQHFFSRLEQEGLFFSVELFFELHRYFLETLYSWGGTLRKVNISKGDTMFAAPEYLSTSIERFGKELPALIPAHDDKKRAVAQKLAIVHNELNALHPFREGNGRTIRLFLDLLSANAGYAPIDWQKIEVEKYFDACKQGMMCNHDPLAKLLSKGLRRE